MKTDILRKTGFFVWIMIFQLLAENSAFSQIVLNYQGRLISGGTAFTGVGQIKFSLVSQDGSSVLWNNDGSTSQAGSSQALSVNVDRGIFSIRLGDKSVGGMAEIPDSLLSNSTVKLRIQFNDGLNGFQALSPDSTIDLTKFQSSNGNSAPVSALNIADTGAPISNGNYSRIQSVKMTFPSTGRFLIRDAVPGAVRTVIFFENQLDDIVLVARGRAGKSSVHFRAKDFRTSGVDRRQGRKGSDFCNEQTPSGGSRGQFDAHVRI